ncbi:MAG: RluA family pseudouridine synthase [Akkermansiaceae bacterium]
MTEPLNIIYQDDWLVAVDKPAGQLVHPADKPKDDDQVTMKILRDQLGQHVYNIHRIDRPTTGVLLFGIDRDAARALHRALERHEVQKTYWAIVSGSPPADAWECHVPLQKHDQAPEREAHTSFRVLEKSTSLALIEATPHTGRTHQIRKHLLHAEIPIVGDYRYAGIDTSDHLGRQLGTGTRMLLQSRLLEFIHPVTAINTAIKSPVDPCFSDCFPSLLKVT